MHRFAGKARLCGVASHVGVGHAREQPHRSALASFSGHGPLLRITVSLVADKTWQGGRNMQEHRAHGHTLRKGRVSEVGRIYLVTTVVRNRRPIFLDWQLGRLLVNVMRQAEQQGRG